MPTTRFAARALLALAALAPSHAALAQTAYTFTNLIDSTTVPTLTPTVDIAFDGDTVAVGGADQIFKITGGVRTTIATLGQSSPLGSIVNFGSFKKIGLSEGNVSFIASSNSRTGVLRGAGGGLTKIAAVGDMSPAGEISFISPSSLASISGTSVAFAADTRPGLTSGIFIGSGGPLLTIRPPVADITTLHIGPTLSGNRAAFKENGPGSSGAILTSDGGPVTTIVKTGDPAPSGTFTVSNLGYPEISGDVVAFKGQYSGGGQGIFTGNGGPLTTIAKTGDAAPSGVFTGFDMGQTADNGQQVSFRGFFGTSDGYFVSDGGVISTVIKRGDMLFGQPVSLVGESGGALDRSGSGRFAFTYYLAATNVRGIAIATPVPEPATASLAACAGLAFPLRRRVSPRLARIRLGLPPRSST